MNDPAVDRAPGERETGEPGFCCAPAQAGLILSGPVPGGSAGDVRPDLVAEWLTARNGDITLFVLTPGTGLRGWWRCRVCTHEWEASVVSRVDRGDPCPQCG